ncbi:RtcB family protein, partial [bacterium]|nr:RtcB family protein [bacterium]
YAKTIDELAKQQIKRMCDHEFTSGSKIRIMPDVHAGKGCTIGTTMTIIDKAVPNIVGVDIGCGMLTVKLEDSTIDFEKLDEAAHFIPSGRNVWEEKQVDFDLNSLHCYKQLKNIKWLENSIGSLGGGNHFIEVEKSKDGIYYLVIHSGSRNLGCQVAEHYQQLAMDLNVGNASYIEQREKIIRELKEAGRFKEIQTALNNLRDNRENTSIPKDLCFLYGKYFEQYLQDMKISQEFAIKNREQMAKILIERAGLTAVESFHTVHNYIDIENMILRKGAIPAYRDQKVLIPINMRDGSVLAVGKGNPDWNYSAPHGAGRIMSRKEAKNKLKLEDYKEVMAGIYTTSISEATLDEAPMAYKSLNDIIDVIGDTVEIVDVMKPVYNFKASE